MKKNGDYAWPLNFDIYIELILKLMAKYHNNFFPVLGIKSELEQMF